MRMRITIKVMICQDSLRQIFFFFYIFQDWSSSNCSAAKVLCHKQLKSGRERERDGEKVAILLPRRQPLQSILCKAASSLSSKRLLFPEPKIQTRQQACPCPLSILTLTFSTTSLTTTPFYKQSRPNFNIPLFINLHSPCPTLVIRLSFLWMFQFCRYDKMRKCKMWRKKWPMCEILQLNCPPLAAHRLWLVPSLERGRGPPSAQLSNPLMLRTHFPIHLKARNPVFRI